MGRPKAFSYIRFSSQEQARGDSYRRQRDAALAFCESNNLEFADSKEYLFFDKGRSAYKGRHLDATSELARFLSYVKDGSIPEGSYLIVESLDRLSREQVKDALPRFLDLLRSKINIYTSTDGRLYTHNCNEMDLLLSIVYMSRAHEESRTKGARVSSAWQQKQLKARDNLTPLGSACPQWLKLVNGRYEEIPERVAAIRKIFDLSSQGYGQGIIPKLLNEAGIPVFGSSKRNLDGMWGGSSVNKILNNRALIGEYQPTSLVDGVRVKIGDPVKGFFPIVIKEDEFYAAKAIRSSRKNHATGNKSQNFNVWQGIAVCGRCGQPMHLVNKGSPPRGYKYLRCYGVAKGTCSAKLIRLDRSENVFREILAKVDSLSLVQVSKGALRSKISMLDQKENEISARLNDIQEMVVNIGGKLPATLMNSIVELERNLEEVREEKEKIKVQLGQSTVSNKRAFFRLLDLVSHGGRFKANLLLKNLNVRVSIVAEDFFHSYVVSQEEKEIFQVMCDGNEYHFYSKNRDIIKVIKGHYDDDFVTSIGEYFLKSGKVV